MPSQHKHPNKSFRPAPDDYEAAQAALPPGHTIKDFLWACLRWLRHDPKQALDTLARFWPTAVGGTKPRSDTKSD